MVGHQTRRRVRVGIVFGDLCRDYVREERGVAIAHSTHEEGAGKTPAVSAIYNRLHEVARRALQGVLRQLASKRIELDRIDLINEC